MSSDISQVFSSLRPAVHGDEDEELFAVAELPDQSSVLAAKAPDGRAAFLVRAHDSEGAEAPYPVVLQNIRFRPDCEASLTFRDGRETKEAVSIIECTSMESSLQEAFIRAVGNLLPEPAELLTNAMLATLIHKLVELFHAEREATASEILGLWGELLTICCSSDPAALVRAWHTESRDRVDFATERERLEVKTTTQSTRRHTLTFEQCHPPADVIALIVSVQTSRLPGGTSIRDLWQECSSRLDDDSRLKQKLDRLCAQTLEKSLSQVKAYAFDRAEAEATLAAYLTEDIPKIEEIPPGVARVKFESDLGLARPFEFESISPADGGIITSLLGGMADGGG